MSVTAFGRTWAGQPSLMNTPHQHDDLEINFVAAGGSMVYLFGGEPVEIGPGEVAVFWAAIPHQLVATTAAQVFWVEVPFATFLGWGLPDAVTGRLLSGPPLVSTRPDPTDPAVFDRWVADLASEHPERTRIATLEVEARVRRHVLAVPQAPAPPYAGGDATLRQAATMARFITERFREPITVPEIAQAARLHPNYAMAQFRRITHTTLGDYLLRRRLAEARRLLVTTALPVGRVAAESGFGSLSQFYAAFTTACGIPPAKYRRDSRVP